MPTMYLGNNGFAQPLVDSLRINRPFLIAVGGHALVAYGAKWADVLNPYGQVVGIQMFEINMIDPMFGFKIPGTNLNFPKYRNLSVPMEGQTIMGAMTFTATEVR